ncbi:hypothetical protein KAK06_17570 [Ideonella sp. 4Y11]|uniref:Uncharacterized protein n=1 Tax=Ideonella aquatica TaxID=2824119 RepID=A0A940YMT0_9BURK|nr:hypothetical protein [Ideonella aquatica]MBQ0960769.1 hypothetical protein [Ideonella aquatica]
MAQVALALAFDDEPELPRGSALPLPEPDSPERTGFELGWDFARHGLVPPAEHLGGACPLRQGWEAGRASSGQRTLRPNRHVRKWLQLRVQAWRRGRAFEGVQVTPHYLAQIDCAVCPVTREPFTHASGADTDASVDRVHNGAGYAAGNLAVISLRANQAKADLRWDEARLMAVLAEQRAAGTADGLSAAEWARMAVLMSFVTPLPHEVAASLPLLVLPPNRLRLLNPIQGLQALITRLLLQPGYATASRRLAELLPAGEARRDFQLVFHSLLPRAWDGGRERDPLRLRQRLEDAWRDGALLRRWQRFARHLDAERAEALVARAVAAGLGLDLGGVQVQLHPADRATEGWALDTGGYIASRAPAPLPLAHRAQA